MIETCGSYTVLARLEHLKYPKKIGYQQYSKTNHLSSNFYFVFRRGSLPIPPLPKPEILYRA